MTTSDKGNRPAPKVQINVRVDGEPLSELEAIGAEFPVPANRSQMVNLAIVEYVERHRKPKAKGK